MVLLVHAPACFAYGFAHHGAVDYAAGDEGGGYFWRCIAQVCPINIWPKLFAADCAIREPFNNWAMFSRDATTFQLPLADRPLCNAKVISQYMQRANQRERFFECFVWGHLWQEWGVR